MSKEREELARYLLQQTADDDPHEPLNDDAVKIERLEAALKWYADRRHYMQRFDPEIDDFTSDIDEDGGLRAFKALGGDK